MPALVLITVILLAALAYAEGVAWALPAVTLLSICGAASRHMGVLAGAAAGTVLSLLGLALVVAIAPAAGVSLISTVALTMAVLAVGAAWLWQPRWPHDRALLPQVLGVAGPAAVALALGIVGAGGITWALLNDGQYHLLSTRTMIADGGLLLDRGNRDPLANEILTLLTLPGRGGVSMDDLMLHDASRQALTVLLLLSWLSILAGLVVASAVPAHHGLVRAGAGLAGAALAWTWFVSGFALRYGFINSIVTIIILLSAWGMWTLGRRQPVLVSGALMLTTTVALTSWAAAAFVPMALGATLVVGHWGTHLQARGRLAAWWVGCLVVSGAYAFGVTARTVAPQGDIGLSAEGEAPAMAPWQLAVFALVVVVLAAIVKAPGGRHVLVGVVSVVIGGLTGLAFLLAQRLDPGVVIWGYYPQKLSWVLAVICVVVIAQLVAHAASADLRRKRDRVALPLVVAGAAVTVMLVVPPASSPLVGRGASMVLPALTIVDGSTGTIRDDLGAEESAFDLIPRVDRPDARIIYSQLVSDEPGEQWANDWSVQLAGTRGDPVGRGSIGDLDLRRPVDVCTLARRWDRRVTVLTAKASIAAEIEALCGGPDLTVTVAG